MNNWQSIITFNPQQCGGRACIRNMRIRVIDILDLVAEDLTFDEIIEELPDLQHADIEAALAYSRVALDHAVIPTT